MAHWNNHNKELSGVSINDPDTEAMFRKIFGKAEGDEDVDFEAEYNRAISEEGHFEEAEPSGKKRILIETEAEGCTVRLEGTTVDILNMLLAAVKSVYDHMGCHIKPNGRLVFLAVMARHMKALTEDAINKKFN